jgi:uncharacterized membrane protein SpoIIM required for sporulation
MIIDLHRFIASERASWAELEGELKRLRSEPHRRMTVEEAMRFHYLYEKVSSDLAKISTFASEPATRLYLESLIGRAYAEIHETRGKATRFAPWRWILRGFPIAFRRHIVAFWVATAIFLSGLLFGGLAVSLDPEAKSALIPAQFSNLLGNPTQRVKEEEAADHDPLAGANASFSATLMTNNIRVSILALAGGITAGVLSAILLFYNGILLGLVASDYFGAGQGVFLMAWLLPHGVIEIPAILVGGQAGLLLGHAIVRLVCHAIFRKTHRKFNRESLRAISSDLTMLVVGVVVMLVWAGLIEAFLSQYHEPAIPYSAKIGFGLLQLVVLVLFLARAGREGEPNR